MHRGAGRGADKVSHECELRARISWRLGLINESNLAELLLRLAPVARGAMCDVR